MIQWMLDPLEKVRREKEKVVPKAESLETGSLRLASTVGSLAIARQIAGHPVEEKQTLDHRNKETSKDLERKDRRAAMARKAKEKERKAKESPSRSAMWRLRIMSRKPKAGMPAGKAMMNRSGNQKLRERRILLALELLTKKIPTRMRRKKRIEEKRRKEKEDSNMLRKNMKEEEEGEGGDHIDLQELTGTQTEQAEILRGEEVHHHRLDRLDWDRWNVAYKKWPRTRMMTGETNRKGKGSKGSKGKGKEADDLLGSVIDVALEDADDHLETGHPTAMSAHPSREELERLQAENQKLQARMNEIQEQLRLA